MTFILVTFLLLALLVDIVLSVSLKRQGKKIILELTAVQNLVYETVEKDNKNSNNSSKREG